MNAAEETIDWLRTDHLQASERWSYLLPTGFSWWPGPYLQTIEIVGEETGPSGESGYLVCVRTELLRDVDLTETALAEINTLPMRCASMSGPVYDVPARRLDLWSLVRVTDDNARWIRFLIGAAAVLQLTEARMLGPLLASSVGARPAISEHPQSGPRSTPDHMAVAAAMVVEAGDAPSAWAGPDVVVDFQFGDTTSTCLLTADQPHPLYGNGLQILQRFPVNAPSDDEGIRMALSLNAADLTRQVTGYGMGSYVYADNALHYTGFIPNALYRPGLLGTLQTSCAARAHRMAARFTEGIWDADAFSLDPRVLARSLDRQRAAAPMLERPFGGCPMMRARAGGT